MRDREGRVNGQRGTTARARSRVPAGPACLIAALAGGLLLTACGPAASPAPASAPAAPPAAQPAAPAAPAAAPASTASAGDWRAEWDKTVAAARQEGKIAIAGPAIPAAREAVLTFQKAYPQ